jgi:DNA-binding NtrC family response regulator
LAKVKAMIVDDDLSVLESFKMVLGIKDYEVTTAKNFEEAASAAKKESLDVAFVDMRFNGKLDGLRILKNLKEIDPSIEVVIVTAYATDKTKIEALELGAMDYISKPFMMEIIYELVERALERRKKK